MKYKLLKQPPIDVRIGHILEEREWEKHYHMSPRAYPDWFEVILPMPEYVKCIVTYGLAELNRIYKTSDEAEARRLFSLDWKQVLVEYKRLNNNFIRSTKEEYEAQKTPKFKVGDWVYYLGQKADGKATDTDYWYPGRVGRFYKYEEEKEGNTTPVLYIDNGEGSNSRDAFRLATYGEIKQHLIEEANKRGYKPGIKVRYEDGRRVTLGRMSYNFKYYPDAGVFCGYGWRLMDSVGNWVEIVKDDEDIRIGDHKVAFRDSCIAIGCKVFYNTDVIKLRDMVSVFELLEVVSNGITVSGDTIRKIAKRIESRK